MALSKVTYVDGVTIIGAKNLNDIQDELIRQGEQQTADEEATAAALALKADKETTYTKTEVDSALALKADKSDTYTKAQVDASLALKADKSDTYTKAEVDASLELKADKTETYTKAQVDSIVEDAIAEAVKESEYSNFEMKSVSGDFIHITDGAGLIPVKDLKIGIDAVQSGSGDPSPENVRPITGWTGAKVNVNGINQWDEEWEVGGYSSSTGNAWSTNDRIRSKSTKPINCLPNMAYYLKASSNVQMFYYDAEDKYISASVSGYDAVYTTPPNCHYIRFATTAVYGTAYKNDISINYPATETDYHAYEGHAYEVTWEDEAGTVYGGTLDVTTGELVVTHKLCNLADLTWKQYTADDANHSFYATPPSDIKPSTGSSYVIDGISSSYTIRHFSSVSVWKTHDKAICQVADPQRFIVRDTDYSDATTFANNLENAQICYTLDTPVSYTIDPTEVLTLLGENNIFADTGAVEELIYRISRQ